MESEKSCSQEQDTRLHPEPAEASPRAHALLLHDSPPTHAVSQVTSFFQVLQLNFDVNFQLGLAYFPNYGTEWSGKDNKKFW
jgi:hypothetical protein